MSKVNLATISSRYGSIDALNANFEAIELALDNVLFLDGTAPNALEADIDMDGNRILNLPNPTTAGEPINLAWATANYSQFQVVAGLAEEIASLGGLTVELEALYAIDGDITIVANIANDVTTVSGINASVSAVASNATNINTVATNLTTTNTIGTVAGSIANVNNVGTAITSVNTVGGHIANVDTVATIYSDVQAVALIDSNVTTVAGDSANITTLAGISADIQTLADIEDGTSATDAIQTVAGISGNVTTVAGISSSVTAVANISGDIQAVENKLLEVSTVADDLLEAVSEIETVAAHVTNIDLVGTNITNVNTVAGIDSQVTAVASNATNVNAVGTDLLGSNTIGTVTSNIVAVNTVATNISSVNDVSTGIANVNAVGSDLLGSNTIGTVSTNIAAVNNVSSISSAVTGVNAISSDVTGVNAIASNVTTVATNISDVTNFADVYYGPSASDPSTRQDGSALQNGDLYFNTTANEVRVYDGAIWVAAYVTLGGALLAANNLSDVANAQTAIDNILPTQATNGGKYLTTDGSTASWSAVESLPSQTGNDGRILTTDGSTATWKYTSPKSFIPPTIPTLINEPVTYQTDWGYGEYQLREDGTNGVVYSVSPTETVVAKKTSTQFALNNNQYLNTTIIDDNKRSNYHTFKLEIFWGHYPNENLLPGIQFIDGNGLPMNAANLYQQMYKTEMKYNGGTTTYFSYGGYSLDYWRMTQFDAVGSGSGNVLMSGYSFMARTVVTLEWNRFIGASGSRSLRMEAVTNMAYSNQTYSNQRCVSTCVLYDPSDIYAGSKLYGIRLFNAYNPAYRMRGVAVRVIVPDANIHTYLNN